MKRIQIFTKILNIRNKKRHKVKCVGNIFNIFTNVTVTILHDKNSKDSSRMNRSNYRKI